MSSKYHKRAGPPATKIPVRKGLKLPPAVRIPFPPVDSLAFKELPLSSSKKWQIKTAQLAASETEATSSKDTTTTSSSSNYIEFRNGAGGTSSTAIEINNNPDDPHVQLKQKREKLKEKQISSTRAPGQNEGTGAFLIELNAARGDGRSQFEYKGKIYKKATHYDQVSNKSSRMMTYRREDEVEAAHKGLKTLKDQSGKKNGKK